MQDPDGLDLAPLCRDPADADHRAGVLVNAHEPATDGRLGLDLHRLAVPEGKGGAPVELHARPRAQRRLGRSDTRPERGPGPGHLGPRNRRGDIERPDAAALEALDRRATAEDDAEIGGPDADV